MARPVIPAQVLLARSVPITLLDGSERRLHFSFRALAIVEQLHGSIGAAFRGISTSTFQTISELVSAALCHDTYDNGEPFTPELVQYLLDPAELATYSAALTEALGFAFPDSDEAAAGDEQSPPDETTPASDGETGGGGASLTLESASANGGP